MPDVYIDILDTVSVTVRGQRQGIRASKQRAMLATLALDVGHAVPIDDLADELWAGHPLANARNALQANATRLRRLLDRGGDGSVLRAAGGGYLLDVPRDAVDCNRFLGLATRGAAALPDRPRAAVELLSAALQVSRGPTLLDAGDGLRCRAAAALFDERRLTVWHDLVSARLAIGDVRQAIAELRRLLAQYPLHEEFIEQLMLALYRCGRQSEALEHFRVTRRRLNEELGLQPGLPLQRRHSAILAQDPALNLPSAVWAGRREPVAAG